MVYINDVPFGTRNFPNGETIFDMGTYYVKDAVNEIKLVYESDADIFKLIVAKKCLDEQSKENRVDYGWDEAIITLTIAYMPYSRMDRQMSSMAFSLRYVAEVINSLNFDSVTILTPHSNVTPALINNVRTIYALMRHINTVPPITYSIPTTEPASRLENISNTLITFTATRSVSFQPERLKSMSWLMLPILRARTF